MAAKPELVPPTPPANPEADWTAAEKVWFDKHGVTEDKEKEIIRGRARVLAYDRHRREFEEKASKPPDEKKGKWYDD